MDASNSTSRLSDYAMTITRDATDKASRHEVRPIDQHEFEMIDGGLRGRANIHTRICTCLKFDYYEIPCSHVIAACRVQNIDPISLCSWVYSIESVLAAYAEPIRLAGHFSGWKQSSTFINVETLPPKRVPRLGRPRTTRFPSANEFRQVHRCSRCGQKGHNKKTCNQSFNTAE
ncbi:uncharacterized protein LOC120084090 [Benincasa hispida]|uniref:uncharacterized protein LOC120084090 n=1 Tax=Benincasa hispida TaxID=102211 RepID=UPI0019028866|nr:uncharacterized protein LOC120084090 [Benincasa hispida]